MDITVLEVNVDGLRLSLGESADGIGVGIDEAETTATEDDAADGRSWLAAVVGLLFLLVLAALARRRLGGEDGS